MNDVNALQHPGAPIVLQHARDRVALDIEGIARLENPVHNEEVDHAR